MRRGLTVAAVATLSLSLVIGCAGHQTCPEAAPGDQDGLAPRVEVSHLTEGKRVFALALRNHRYWVTDVKLPTAVLTNRDAGPVTVVQVVVAGFTGEGDEPVAAVFLRRAPLLAVQQATTAKLKKALAEPSVADMVAVALGTSSVTAGELDASEAIAPGASAVLPVGKLAHMHHVGVERLSRLTYEITVDGPSGRGTVSFPIPIARREPRDYRFPLTGQVTIGNMALTYGHHRRVNSQEFGIDIISSRSAANGALETSPGGSTQTVDYYIYGRDVMAIGDGVVAAVGDRFPDAAAIPPGTFSATSTSELMNLAPTIGFANALSGNYVVIDHGHGEYGFYAHLAEGSIRHRPGDPVRQGEVVGRVGNTGNSSEPHLHFQLMDGPDLLRANGLPVAFSNVRLVNANLGVTEASTLWGSLFAHTTIE